MKKRLLFLVMLLVAWASPISLNAQEGYVDVTNQYLTNADFEASTPISSNLKGYGKDGTPYGFQAVDGWTFKVLASDIKETSYPNSGMAGAVFAYGSEYQLQGGNKAAPENGPETGANKALGFFAVWECGGYYYQSVKLPSGAYKIEIPVYNQLGTQANTTYTGFFPTSGTDQTVAINTAVGSWATQTVSFILAEETEGQIRLGYKASNNGKDKNPHLFFDKVKILYSKHALASQMTELATQITQAESKTLGFEAGEYAPYNNVAAIKALTEAKKVDLDQPDNYTATDIEDLIDALQNATWTANAEEVNAIAWGDLSQYETEDGRDYPYGWNNTYGRAATGSQISRIMGGSEGSSNAGLTATTTGKAMLLKYSGIYGENTGYTMPLKANTYYTISFKYCGWNNQPTTNVVVKLGETPVTVEPASFRPETTDGHTNPQDWYVYKAIFKTAEAGNYTLALSKSNSEQQQIAWGDMKLVKAKATDFTLAEGPMNAAVKNAQTVASNNFNAQPTDDNYVALLAAIEEANQSVAVYQQIAERLNVLKEQKGSISETDWEALPVYTNYTDGVYETLNEVVPTYTANVTDYWNTHTPVADNDLTALLLNRGFELGTTDGWTFNKFDDSKLHKTVGDNQGHNEFEGTDGNWMFCTWSQNNATTVNLKHTINNVPNGTYTIKGIFASYEGTVVTLKVGDQSNTVTCPEPGTGREGELTFVVDNNKIEFESTATQFLKADKFSLIYKSTDVADELENAINQTTNAIDTNQPMNTAVKEKYEAALEAWNAQDGHTPKNYIALNSATKKALASIDAYQKCKEALDAAAAFILSTNVYTPEAYHTFYDFYDKQKTLYDNGAFVDSEALALKYYFFGNKTFHQKELPVVPLLGSAWDDKGDYTWKEGDYWVNTWSSEGETDGSNMTVPFMEYRKEDGTLAPKTLEATMKSIASTQYNVTALVRVLTTDGSTPQGVTLQIASHDANNKETITAADPSWTKIEGTNYYYADLAVQGNSDYDSDGDGYGDLHIQYNIAEGNNISWLAYKNMFANPTTPVEKSKFDTIKTGLANAISEANNYKLGFDKDEYAPYTNVTQCKAKDVAKHYYDALITLDKQQNLTDEEYVSRAPSFIMMKQALTDITKANEKWTQNQEQLNGFFWKSNYTNDDVEMVYHYNSEGKVINQFRTIFPTGWDLNGRVTAYSTRIVKFGVNDDNYQPGRRKGFKSSSDLTVLGTKWDTAYGKESGYTLPLDKDVTYNLSFIYSAWDVEKDIPIMDVVIYNKATNEEVNNLTLKQFKPKDGNGDIQSQENWYYYRATFTPADNGEYVIELKKNREGRGDEQLQLCMGDFVLIRDTQADHRVEINGEDKDEAHNQTPKDLYNNAQVYVTRNFNTNDGNGCWNTIMLPFNLDYQETVENFGTGTTSFFTGTEYSEAEGKYTLLFETRNTGIKANQPVMIYFKDGNPNVANLQIKTRHADPENATDRTKDTFDYTYGAVVIRPFDNGVIDETTTLKGEDFNFVGTYSRTTIPKFSVFINAKNEWKRSNGNNKISPTRAYFLDNSEDGSNSAKLLGFKVDDQATGIIAIDEEGTMTVTSGNIYTIDGRLVRQNATSLEGLQPGIYVVDGKKYIIK